MNVARSRRAHAHTYGVHPNPSWTESHGVCTICGFACPHHLVRIALGQGATATPEYTAMLEAVITCWCGATLEAGTPHYPGGDPENGPGHFARDQATHCHFCGRLATRKDENYRGESRVVICEHCHDEQQRLTMCGQVLASVDAIPAHERECPVCIMYSKEGEEEGQ